jgi:hypothetical protein
MKRYLLIAGYDSSPQCDITKLIDSFVSFEQAMEEVKAIEKEGEKKIYEIRGKQYDWYCIDRMFTTGYTKE